MPTYEADPLQPSRPAAAAIAERVFATYNSSNQITLASAGGPAHGIVRYKVDATSDETTLETRGNLSVLCGGTFSAGDEVMSDAAGKAIKWAGDAVKLGLALTAGSSGNRATIRFYEVSQRVNPTRGANVASVAGLVVLPAADYFHITGALAITGFTNPAGIQDGYRITVIPDGTFTWTTATNISLAGTAVVSKVLDFVWDATTAKWNPSYVA